MSLLMVGCNHQNTNVAVRERLAFSPTQCEEALSVWRDRYPDSEAVLLSTCNRVELYAATATLPDQPLDHLAGHLADYHQVPLGEVRNEFVVLEDADVVHHLFRVVASLDSMVVGEPQILSQVKEAYELASRIGSVGPTTHHIFQSALRTARRIAAETSLHKYRVSIPSVAVGELARRIFERFDDKRILILGAGEMAEETVRYLVDHGAREFLVANRSTSRGAAFADRWRATQIDWEHRWEGLGNVDMVISTTGAEAAVIDYQQYKQRVIPMRRQKPLLILDLAVPRDVDPRVGELLDTYLYSIDDLSQACEENRQARAAELPAAEQIVTDETRAFLASMSHRDTVPVIAQLQQEFRDTQAAELERLFRKLPDLDEKTKREISQFANRLVGKLLHPPLASLREEAGKGSPHTLLEAIKRLFQLSE